MHVSAYVTARCGRGRSSTSSRCQRSARTTVARPYSAIAPASARISAGVWGSWGACCLDAHHTTAASATSETITPSTDRGERRRRGGAAGGGATAGGCSEVGVSVLTGRRDQDRPGGGRRAPYGGWGPLGEAALARARHGGGGAVGPRLPPPPAPPTPPPPAPRPPGP